MLITTIEQLPNQSFTPLGMVQGSTIQTKNIGRDITQGLKTIVGGELGAYTQMMDDARQIAINRMEQQARSLGADAIIGVRLSTSSIMQGAAEVVAYGTAVQFNG